MPTDQTPEEKLADVERQLCRAIAEYRVTTAPLWPHSSPQLLGQMAAQKMLFLKLADSLLPEIPHA